MTSAPGGRFPEVDAKGFNVVLVHPPGFIHSLALKEAADYVHAALVAGGYRSVRSTNHVAHDAYNVIFCAHLLSGDDLRRIPADSIIFNSEALEDVQERQFYSAAYPELLRRFFVWDYSHRNLPLIAHDGKAVVPFLSCNSLKRTDITRSAGPNLLFYGRITERRAAILNDLGRRGIPVRVVCGEYGQARDAHLFGCRAVLNLHKNDDTLAFEPIRCFYPLINDIPVISEAVNDPSAKDFDDSIFFFDRMSLVDGIVALYENRTEFEGRSRSMLAAFRNKDPVPAVSAAVEKFLRHCVPVCGHQP